MNQDQTTGLITTEPANSDPSAVVLGMVGGVNLARIGSLLGHDQRKIYNKKYDIHYRIEMLFQITDNEIDSQIEAYYDNNETDDLEFNDFNVVKTHIGEEIHEIIYESENW